MRFTRAIVRPPAATFADRDHRFGPGPPDLALALEQHEAYCRTLERLGLSLLRLEPDARFPDSTFVEDAAIVTGAGRDPHPPRRRRAAPARWRRFARRSAGGFPTWTRSPPPALVDGGDVCEAGAHFFIGASARTNAEGAAQLAAWLEKRGFGSSLIDIRQMPGLLHLKTGLSWLGGRRLFADGEAAGHEALGGWEVVRVPGARSTRPTASGSTTWC